MLVERAIHEACNFPGEEAAPREQFLLRVIVTFFVQNRHHLFAKQFPMFGGVQKQQLSVDGEHRSALFRHYPQSRQACEVLHPVDLCLQVAASLWRQAVRLTASGNFFLFEALDPIIVE